jgi:myo-inositol-1(or 4)-monophosphatase
MLDFTIDLAREAGALLYAGFRGKRQLDFKSRADLVTDMDIASERLLVERIVERFPDHQILAEEGGGHKRDSRWTWLIDPLDGTTNYAHGYPFWAVSLALLQDETLQLGVVYDPVHDECFSATVDGGAQLNGQPIHVSTTSDLQHALLATGFSYARWSEAVTNTGEVTAMVMQCRDLRRTGSAALDLCYVATGRSDGFWEMKLSPWDTAVGALIVQAAGGQITTRHGTPFNPWQPSIVASNGLLHESIMRVLQNS